MNHTDSQIGFLPTPVNVNPSLSQNSNYPRRRSGANRVNRVADGYINWPGKKKRVLELQVKKLARERSFVEAKLSSRDTVLRNGFDSVCSMEGGGPKIEPIQTRLTLTVGARNTLLSNPPRSKNKKK